ncbi:hypothetical protein N7462_010660 [Penicillium macrosclerotiorum]|uniref:uncharacterized protein n=1 Tax=Penicillium macrosclerotiorum TaxID=303699 RepID=UPI002546C517|nr:uncharacterized protein N7462_010660 [Penicillium macrosclerotiorum]KAJ5669590.1 hypothetical protein N7462_010660 [Penicillium macrosclerotiorum]
MEPIIRPDNIHISLPADINLYQASSLEWSQQFKDSPNYELELYPQSFFLPELCGPVHAFSLYGLMCTVLLRISADICRLVVNSDLADVDKHQYVPWKICQLDKRASIAVPILMHAIQSYNKTFKESNPNGIVIWHSMCIILTVDINLLARAGGRDGTQSMKRARQSLTTWVHTPAARRACVHAAQTFQTLSHRKPADGTAFQSVRALFMSALVLGLYILKSERSHDARSSHDAGPFDLAKTPIDWPAIANVGISDDISQCSHHPSGATSALINFIQFGGPIIINGRTYKSGARHAQRIVLEFASLLDEVGTHWMAGYAQVLYMIHDTMEETAVIE